MTGLGAALLLCAALAPASVHAQASKGLVVVLPIDATEASITRAMLQTFEETVRTAAGDQLRPRGYTVLTGETTLTLLTDNGVDPLKACESSCALEAARQISAKLFISGTLTKSEAEYVGFIRLFEIDAGSQLGFLHVEGPTMKDLRWQFMEKAPEFFARALRSQAGATSAGSDSVVSVGGVLLPDVPVLSGQLSREGVVRLDADTEVLEAHALAVERDAHGKDQPGAAAVAWERLHAFTKGNPFRAEAAARAKLWREYDEKQKAYAAQVAEDTRRLQRVLPLATIAPAQKAELLGAYLQSYGHGSLSKLLGAVPAPARAEVCVELARRGVGHEVEVQMPHFEGVLQQGELAVDGVRLGAAPGRYRLPDCVSRVRITDQRGNGWEDALRLEPDGQTVLRPRFAYVHKWSFTEWHAQAEAHERGRSEVAGRRNLGIAVVAGGAALLAGALVSHGVSEGAVASIRTGGLPTATDIEAAHGTAVLFNGLKWAFGLAGVAGLAVGVPAWMGNLDRGEFQPPAPGAAPPR